MATTRPHLTIAELLAMTEEDLRIECLRLEIPAGGFDKNALKRLGLRPLQPVRLQLLLPMQQ